MAPTTSEGDCADTNNPRQTKTYKSSRFTVLDSTRKTMAKRLPVERHTTWYTEA